MKIHHSLKAAIAALLFGAATHATAGLIQVGATGLPTSNYLTAGTYQGSFKLDGVLGLPSAYTVNSLSFTFRFLDDSTDPFTSVTGAATGSSTTTTVTGSGQSRTATTTTTYLVPVTRTGEQESVKLSIGGVSFLGQTAGVAGGSSGPVTTSKTAVKGTTVWAKNNGVVCTEAEVQHDNSCKEAISQTVEATQATTTTIDYTGAFAIEGSLLANLLQDKALNFSVDVTGDLYLAGATLNVNYIETARTFASADVPEPASLALFGIALAGIAGMRRKRSA